MVGSATTAAGAPLIIEAAVNGETSKRRNASVARTPDEIAEDGVRCIDAGAAIVHNHNVDPVLGTTVEHDPAPYIEAWRAILAQRPDAILYPTMGSGGPHTTIERRYSHIPALAEAGVLGQGLIDPGSVNLGRRDEEGLPAPVDSVYVNTYRDARYMFDTCNRLDWAPASRSLSPASCASSLPITRPGRCLVGHS